MPKEIVVSVICNAYNHAPYIRECLDSLTRQQADFPYEILVHDDASTDGTADIIRACAALRPGIIKPLYQTENQYSKGGVMRFQYPRAKGRYIALCEGDDYWTDPLKLRKQVSAMDAHPEIDICAHAADRIDGSTGAILERIAPSDRDTVFNTEEVIKGGGLFVATSSLLFRASLNDSIPPFRQNRKTDYTLQIHGALRGGMLYLADNMSVYRFKTPGSWSMQQDHNIGKQRAFVKRVTDMLLQLDQDTQQRYHDAVKTRIDAYGEYLTRKEWEHNIRERHFAALLAPEYAAVFSELPFYKRAGLRACAVWPGLYGLWKAVRGGARRGNERDGSPR